MNTNIRKSLTYCRPRYETADHILAGAVEELAAFAMRFFDHSAEDGGLPAFFRDGEFIRDLFINSTEGTADTGMLPPTYFAQYIARLVSMYGEGSPQPLSVGDFFPAGGERSRAHAQGVLSLVQNETTDAAKDAFAPHAHFKSVLHPRSFVAACEDVYDGMSEYCILPLFHSEEGKLYAFYRLIDRYELVIDRVADILMDDSETLSRLALLRKFSPSLFTGKTGDAVLAVTTVPDAHFSPGYLLCAIESLGGEVLEIDSVPGRHGGSVLEYGISLRHRTQDTPLMLAAIAAMSSVWTLKGFYQPPSTSV